MKVLVTGANGQLGYELQRTVPAGVDVEAIDRDGLDIGDREAVREYVRAHSPALVINAAGYTAVDRAESEKEEAYRVNGVGPGNLAEALAEYGGRLVHVSTDYVFDGASSRPYRRDDVPRPLGIYGKSKLEGERRAFTGLGRRTLVLRTSWLYSAHGNNFVKTMLRLMGERDEVRVVSDQVGTPTWAKGLARAIWAAAARPELNGLYHWTDSGVASWYDFACAVEEEGRALGLLARATRVVPIRTDEFPAPARRPPYSVLDKADTYRDFGTQPVHWRVGLRAMLKEVMSQA